MTLAEYSMTAFAIANGGRVIAYVPQIMRVCRDPNGAAAVSVTTWIFFTAANVATVVYALTALDDVVTASVFGLNAIGCLLIVALTAFRRMTTGGHAPQWPGLIFFQIAVPFDRFISPGQTKPLDLTLVRFPQLVDFLTSSGIGTSDAV